MPKRPLQLALVVLCLATALVTVGAFWLRSVSIDDNIARVKKEADARIAAVRAEAIARDLTACRVQNAFRKHDLETWIYVLGVAPPRDAAAKGQSARFRAFITAKDAPIPCLAVSHGHVPSTTSLPPLTTTTKP